MYKATDDGKVATDGQLALILVQVREQHHLKSKKEDDAVINE